MAMKRYFRVLKAIFVGDLIYVSLICSFNRSFTEYAKRENISLSSDTSLPMFILTFNILRISLRTSGAVLTKLVIIKYKYIIANEFSFIVFEKGLVLAQFVNIKI